MRRQDSGQVVLDIFYLSLQITLHSPLCPRKLATWTAPLSSCSFRVGLVNGRHHKETGVLEEGEVGFIPSGHRIGCLSLPKASSPQTTALPDGSRQSLQAQRANVLAVTSPEGPALSPNPVLSLY